MELLGIFVLVLPFVIGYKMGKQAGIRQRHIDSLPEKEKKAFLTFRKNLLQVKDNLTNTELLILKETIHEYFYVT